MAIAPFIVRGTGGGSTLRGGNTLRGETVVAPQFTVDAPYVTIQGHMNSSAMFAQVTVGEPTAWGDADRLYGAIWTLGTRIPYVTLGTAVRIYDTRVRLYTKAFKRPQDSREFELARAVQQVSSRLFGDFTLGGTIREIDISGQFGQPVRARWGHAPVAGVMYRIADIDLALVVNDSSTTSL